MSKMDLSNVAVIGVINLFNALYKTLKFVQ